jgi:chorismate mutase/prephenate dehydratase
MSKTRTAPEAEAAAVVAPPATPAAPPPPTEPALDLAALRAELDTFDDALHDLLMRRFALIERLGSSRAKGAGTALRPGREAIILRRLLARHTGPLPRAALVRLWREMLAASTAMQGGFSIAVLAPAAAAPAAEATLALAREHFGAATPVQAHPAASRALAAVAAGEAAVAVLPAPQEADTAASAWWATLDAPLLQVVARLPFLAPRRAAAAAATPEALVVSSVPADPTGHDRSLIRLECPAGQAPARLAAALAEAGLPPRGLILLRRDGAAALALAEVDGFLADAEGAARLAALPFPRAQILGAYAVPETGE